MKCGYGLRFGAQGGWMILNSWPNDLEFLSTSWPQDHDYSHLRSVPVTPLGVCSDCGGPARSRRNWAAIAIAFRSSASSFHHLCGRCYVFRVLDQERGGKAIRAARRPFVCEACGEASPREEPARSFDRPADHERGWRERVRVCGCCFEAWLRLYRPRL